MTRCHTVKAHRRCRKIGVARRQRGGSLRRYIPPRRKSQGGHGFGAILTGLSLLPMVKPLLKSL